MTSKKIEFMSGKLYWTKILGAPVPNYERTGREWTFEFEPDEAGIAILKAHKLTDRLKSKYEDEGRGQYLTLRKTELSRDGNENPPIRVYYADNSEWDAGKLIGNGSTADVKLDIRDYGVGKKKGIYPTAIRITNHIPYQSTEFGAMDKGEEGAPPAKRVGKTAKQTSFEEDFGLATDDLDDEIPV